MSPIPPALARAFAKAEAEDLFGVVTYDAAHNEWEVQSRSGHDPYRVVPLQGHYDSRGRKMTPATPFFEKLWCSCPAQASGFLVCWHKCAVKLAHDYGFVPDLSGAL